jgi:hypothetical protein
MKTTQQTLIIDNQPFYASERMLNLFYRYENEPRMLSIIKEMGIELGELTLRSLYN